MDFCLQLKYNTQFFFVNDVEQTIVSQKSKSIAAAMINVI